MAARLGGPASPSRSFIASKLQLQGDGQSSAVEAPVPVHVADIGGAVMGGGGGRRHAESASSEAVLAPCAHGELEV